MHQTIVDFEVRAMKLGLSHLNALVIGLYCLAKEYNANQLKSLNLNYLLFIIINKTEEK